MKTTLLATVVIVLVGCTQTPTTPMSVCAALESECEQEDSMLVLGGDATSREILQTVISAADLFEKRFGWAPTPTAVVPGGNISIAQDKLLDAAGYTVQLPWLTAGDKAKLLEGSIRSQVEAQTAGLPDSVREAAVAKALAAIDNKSSPDSTDSLHDGALAHELGHLWYIAMTRRGGAAHETGHAYGGFAPDWLDETFAVLMETDEMRERRRAAFRDMNAEDIVPLREFLTMTHPAAEAAKQLHANLPTKKEGSASQVIVLTKEEAKDFLAQSGGGRASQFYSQVQVFADYMLARAGEATVYVTITDWLVAGGTFESWLASEGATHGLPTTLEQLERDWMAWLAS